MLAAMYLLKNIIHKYLLKSIGSHVFYNRVGLDYKNDRDVYLPASIVEDRTRRGGHKEVIEDETGWSI